MSKPRLILVWPLEDQPFAYVQAFTFEDEQRLRHDLHGRRRLALEIADAVEQLLEALDEREKRAA